MKNVKACRAFGTFGALFATLFVLLIVSGCGGDDASSSKRLPGGGSCDLITGDEAAQSFGVPTVEVAKTDAIQCDYQAAESFAGANVVRGQDMSMMATDEKLDLGGVSGVRLNTGDRKSTCGVSVTLQPGEADQRFGVIVNGVGPDSGVKPCEVADDMAKKILKKIPG